MRLLGPYFAVLLDVDVFSRLEGANLVMGEFDTGGRITMSAKFKPCEVEIKKISLT